MNKHRQRLNEAIESGQQGHTARSVLKMQADAYDEGYDEVVDKILHWENFQEWHKNKYGQYPSDPFPAKLMKYLLEMKNVP